MNLLRKVGPDGGPDETQFQKKKKHSEESVKAPENFP